MITSIVAFIIVLSVLILVHEFGHFITAKKNGIWVEEFGLGMPPRIWGKKYGETLYSLNLLPFGGFVRLHGENSDEGISKPNRAYLNKSKKVRAAVVTAGVVMNILLALVAFSVSYSFTGVPKESENVKIVGITNDSPAEEVGLKLNDIIREVDGEEIKSTQTFIKYSSSGQELEMTIERDGSLKEFNVIPRSEYPENDGPLGVVISTTETYFPPIWQRPFYGMYYGFQDAIYWGAAVISGFVSLFSNLFSGHLPQDIAGPVGIYAITAETASYGVIAVVNFIGILSINLAVLNIIPFPALDGGRLLFIVLEGIFGKKVLPKVEQYVHAVGMVLLILLLIVITFSDVRRLIQAGSISGFLDSFVP